MNTQTEQANRPTIGDRAAYDVVLRNSSGGELDRKSGDDLGNILREYAKEGCLSGGDTLTIIDFFEEEPALIVSRNGRFD